jgi:hypothetical protein
MSLCELLLCTSFESDPGMLYLQGEKVCGLIKVSKFQAQNLKKRMCPQINKLFKGEKRGGLKVVAFDRSPFKLSMLRFSNKSVQAPSCERHRTAHRSMFLSFEINNFFQISA